jgi:hypothetical protein
MSSKARCCCDRSSVSTVCGSTGTKVGTTTQVALPVAQLLNLKSLLGAMMPEIEMRPNCAAAWPKTFWILPVRSDDPVPFETMPNLPLMATLPVYLAPLSIRMSEPWTVRLSKVIAVPGMAIGSFVI